MKSMNIAKSYSVFNTTNNFFNLPTCGEMSRNALMCVFAARLQPLEGIFTLLCG